MIPHLPIPARFRIYLRFVHYLVWEFRWPLGVFVTLVLGGGTTLWLFYHHEPLSFSRACHAVFLMIFLESSIDFPDEWYLQPCTRDPAASTPTPAVTPCSPRATPFS